MVADRIIFSEDITFEERAKKPMGDYARERAIEILKDARSVVLATNGPSGVQAGEFHCEAVGLEIYLLLPRTSDHLLNLEQDDRIALHSPQWELTGKGHALVSERDWPVVSIVPKTEAAWYVLVKITPGRIHVLRKEGWGPAETIDISAIE